MIYQVKTSSYKYEYLLYFLDMQSKRPRHINTEPGITSASTHRLRPLWKSQFSDFRIRQLKHQEFQFRDTRGAPYLRHPQHMTLSDKPWCPCTETYSTCMLRWYGQGTGDKDTSTSSTSLLEGTCKAEERIRVNLLRQARWSKERIPGTNLLAVRQDASVVWYRKYSTYSYSDTVG